MHQFLNVLLTLAFQDSDAVSAAADTAAESVETATKVAEAAENAAPGSGFTGFLILVGILALIVVPFVLGQLIANAMKVKEWGMRIGVCLFALVLGGHSLCFLPDCREAFERYRSPWDRPEGWHQYGVSGEERR